jgi:hypothetical protein
VLQRIGTTLLISSRPHGFSRKEPTQTAGTSGSSVFCPEQEPLVLPSSPEPDQHVPSRQALPLHHHLDLVLFPVKGFIEAPVPDLYLAGTYAPSGMVLKISVFKRMSSTWTAV